MILRSIACLYCLFAMIGAQIQLEDNVKLEQQIVQANAFANYVVRFTMKQPPMGSNKVFFMATPCSGLVTMLVARNRLPNMQNAELVLSSASGVQFGSLDYFEPMQVFFSVYGNTSATFQMVASISSAFAPFLFQPANMTVTPTTSSVPGNMLNVQWNPPQLIYANFYRYKIYYAIRNGDVYSGPQIGNDAFVAIDGRPCNMHSFCGIENCATSSFTKDFVTYTLNGNVYSAQVQLPNDVDVNQIMINIAVSDIHTAKIGVYEPYAFPPIPNSTSMFY